MKITILGSCRFSPYEILVKPDPIPGAWNTEEGYKIASKKFYPAIEESDLIIVYAPDGIGEHTGRDINKALDERKRVILIMKDRVIERPTYRYAGARGG